MISASGQVTADTRRHLFQISLSHLAQRRVFSRLFTVQARYAPDRSSSTVTNKPWPKNGLSWARCDSFLLEGWYLHALELSHS